MNVEVTLNPEAGTLKGLESGFQGLTEVQGLRFMDKSLRGSMTYGV